MGSERRRARSVADTWKRTAGLLAAAMVLLVPGTGSAAAEGTGLTRASVGYAADANGEPSIAVPYQVDELWRRGITGRGATVAVLVSFGDPGMEKFMADYDEQYALPPADIRRVEPLGKPPSCTDPGVNTENCLAWVSESRLDVAMVHSLAPEARIVIAASDPRVTAVGGSLLHVDPQGHRTSPDTLWPKSGAGHSSVFPRPPWQRSGASAGSPPGRSLPDITMQGAAGTSQSAPLFAGVLALAVQLHHGPLGDINPALYRLGAAGPAAGIVDVTQGSNSYAEVPGFNAKRGFDTASGWGTVDVPRFVRALARALT
ncbi:hypothetical protein [Streptomyces sp. NPDC090053]|uniref:hypothetical protein n=1 Tax=Streptomyces sp. NPDC090053 TaxID=3365932 RepID=UPI00380A08B4